MRKATVLLFVALSTLSAAAQETFFSESIDVRIINVDVIVTDRKGAPVAGLTKDDFEVRENGAAKEVTNFYEYRGLPAGPGVKPPQTEKAENAPATPVAPATADLRPRRIVIFIDDNSLQPSNRNRVFPALRHFIGTALRPGDTVMIARWDHSLEFALEFTGDAKIAEAKLDELAKKANTGATRNSELNTFKFEITPIPPDTPTIDMGISGARLFAQRIVHEHHRKIEAMRSLLSSMRGLDGRKVFVFLSETLSEEPGREAFDYLYLIRHKFIGGEHFIPELVQEDYSDHAVVSRISEPANSAGVTLYPIDAGGLDSTFDRISAEGGMAVGASEGSSREEAPESRAVVLNRIAAATGGVASTLSNNFELAFATIANDLNSYYSLGYRADAQRQDAVRSIEVRMKKKGYTVRTRNSFVEKSLTAEMSDAVAANLFYPIEKNDLKIAMNAGAKTAAGENATIPVTITIPTSSLTLLPDGSDLTGRFSTYAAFVRHDGVVSQVKSQTHQLRFPAESLGRRKEITLKLDVTVDNGTDGLSVGVMDDVSRATGFATIRM